MTDLTPERPDFVHPIVLPGTTTDQTLAEVLGVSERELREMEARLQEQFDRIAEAQAAAMRHAHEVVIWR